MRFMTEEWWGKKWEKSYFFSFFEKEVEKMRRYDVIREKISLSSCIGRRSERTKAKHPHLKLNANTIMCIAVLMIMIMPMCFIHKTACFNSDKLISHTIKKTISSTINNNNFGSKANNSAATMTAKINMSTRQNS